MPLQAAIVTSGLPSWSVPYCAATHAGCASAGPERGKPRYCRRAGRCSPLVFADKWETGGTLHGHIESLQ